MRAAEMTITQAAAWLQEHEYTIERDNFTGKLAIVDEYGDTVASAEQCDLAGLFERARVRR